MCDQVFTVNAILEMYSPELAALEMNMLGLPVNRLDKMNVTVFTFGAVSNVISLAWFVIDTKLTQLVADKSPLK